MSYMYNEVVNTGQCQEILQFPQYPQYPQNPQYSQYPQHHAQHAQHAQHVPSLHQYPHNPQYAQHPQNVPQQSSNQYMTHSSNNLSISSATGASANLSTTATVGAAHSYSSSAAYLSDIELAILKSSVPINLQETEEISVLGHTGIWANKTEVVNWRGPRPINEYPINMDDAPEILTKRTQETLTYIQELAVRYLKPPSPPPPGEIIIQQEVNTLAPPAPPLIIRQQPPRPSTPEPLVIREAPPPAPQQIGRKVITISGKRLPPPPRKVVIERLAPLPSKPQSVIIERWLPYTQPKRRVIYQRGNAPEPVVVKPRNIIIQWEAPQVQIRKDFKYLGIIRANPVEYVQRYGSQLKQAKDLPSFVLDIKPPEGIVLAADYQYNQVHELEGDLHALRLIDLEQEGLGQYRNQLNSHFSISAPSTITGHSTATTISSLMATQVASTVPAIALTQDPLQPIQYQQIPPQHSVYQPPPPQQPPVPQETTNLINSKGGYSTSSIKSYNSNLLEIVGEIFSQVDSRMSSNGRLTIEEAEKLLLKLNSRLGRRYSEDDLRRFFYSLNIQQDGTISLEEFRVAFERVL